MIMRAFLLLSTLTVTLACPYLDGAETKGSPPHPHYESSSMHRQLRQRQTQAITPPTTLAGAITLATQLIRRLDVDRPDTNWAAKFLRLSFHDCVGGCDGCVDLANPSNFGLDIPIDALEPITVAVAAFLTVADVWALAGLVGAQEHQLPGTTKVLFPLDLVGRPSCPGNAIRAGPHRELPKAHFTTSQVVDYFATNFAYTPKETVAILGSHSMGRAFAEHSGFDGDGSWDNDPLHLNNGYYKSLLSSQRFNLVSNPPVLPSFPTENFFWEAEPESGGHFMVHADMALAFDLSAHMDIPSTGHVTCVMNDINPGDVLCPASSLLPHTEFYSQNNGQFVRDFKVVFTKMVNMGCGNGVCRPVVVPPTRAPVRVPTRSPTRAPTKRPTTRPTKAPTKRPTKAPSKQPTKAPTRSPTGSPVKAPTAAPVNAPTEPPRTKAPLPLVVDTPTAAPVQSSAPPSAAPVKIPTSAPIPSPTNAPVASPTNAPVPSPTNAPVTSPTSAPVPAPTNAPLPAPTSAPIIDVKDTCKPGFTLVNNVCVSVCDMPCPANSVRIPGRQCYETFADCQCNVGFKRGANECVANCPEFEFHCPFNSVRIPERLCYTSFDDCQCNTGLVKLSGRCVSPQTPTNAPAKAPTNAPVKPPTKAPLRPPTSAPLRPPTKAPANAACPNFNCPAHSVRIPGKDCYRSIADCQCNDGFSPTNSQCVCTANFQCPVNSVRRPNRLCYNNFDDCQCSDGFSPTNGQCVCTANFQCPANSVRRPNRLCYNNFEDCQCNTGFNTVNGQCVRPAPVPVPRPVSVPVPAPRPVAVPVAVPVRQPSGAGYCNWGPAGTAASSTCDGRVQGGPWCTASRNNCEFGCRGKWCV